MSALVVVKAYPLLQAVTQLGAAADELAARKKRIEELAASFAEIKGSGAAINVFTEMIRILTEQGVDETIAYVGTQRPSILKAVGDIAKTAHERMAKQEGHQQPPKFLSTHPATQRLMEDIIRKLPEARRDFGIMRRCPRIGRSARFRRRPFAPG
jgi:hypothetical protein